MRAEGDGWELWLGRWQDELADVEVDAIVCDPPYGKQVHESFYNERYDQNSLHGISPSYEAWSSDHVNEFVRAWSARCRGWIVVLTSHDLIPVFQQVYRECGRYSFAPIPCVMRGMSVRLAGDGPSSWSVYAMVARPRTNAAKAWGTLDGAYYGPKNVGAAGGGRGKPDWLMNAIIRDYTRPGDLVCDPFAGWGSTLAAAVANGRRAIGSEMDKDAFNEAVRRLNRPLQTDLFAAV